MKLLRHLLSHVILILVLFGIVTVYYYRHQILPENIAQKISSYAERIHPKLASFSKTKQIVVVADASDSENNKTTNVKIGVENELSEVVVDNEESETDVKQDASEQASSNSEVALAEDVPVAEDTSAGETIAEKDNAVEHDIQDSPDSDQQEVTTKSETDPEDLHTASTDKEMASAGALLKVARIAYHEGNPHVAIKIYKELIELENDEADYYGELGNVYYAIGNWDKAGNAYYEAATRLIEQNQFAQVSYLQRVIQGLNADYADKLADQLAKVNQ